MVNYGNTRLPEERLLGFLQNQLHRGHWSNRSTWVCHTLDMQGTAIHRICVDPWVFTSDNVLRIMKSCFFNCICSQLLAYCSTFASWLSEQKENVHMLQTCCPQIAHDFDWFSILIYFVFSLSNVFSCFIYLKTFLLCLPSGKWFWFLQLIPSALACYAFLLSLWFDGRCSPRRLRRRLW